MSHASSSKISKYDVFLSFRGEDTRTNFVSHLYNALEQRGIRTFIDDKRLETGKTISDELIEAIEEARFAVVIFSKNYASSRWCLEELAHIIKCKNELEQNVKPVFYDVSPRDVRKQNPPFDVSFSQYEEEYKDDMRKVQRWRDAFVVAGNISGYDLKKYKDEAECVKTLVDDIFPMSLQIISLFPKNSVGMESQFEKVSSLLNMESNDVRSIGIWGMGGIGKTEIATALHERYRCHFDADCFIADIGKHQKKRLKWLKDIICKLLGENVPLTCEHEGLQILNNYFCKKKVLFILDDVNHREQLEFLLGKPNWFGKGSRIILTGRDKHLLIRHTEGNVYEVQLLSEDAALELFCKHAFNEKSPKEDFMELSTQVVKHAGGLPLALEVLGCSLYNRNKEQWRHIIDRLKRIPPNDILGKLRLSFDGLDKDEKELFLDITFINIACLTRYDDRLCADLVLRATSHGYLMDQLIEKSLLSVDIDNSIVMQNMMRAMGEDVIGEENAKKRIWLPKDVCDLFKGKLITKEVKNLCIPEDCDLEDDPVNYNNIFKTMEELQILIIGDGTFSWNCDITFLPSSLRFIDWPGYPSRSLPESFEPSHLVVLCLRGSLLEDLRPISKKLSNLKHLDLSDSCELRKPPNFGDMPNLERLYLEGCVNLKKVHSSLGSCRMLTDLSLFECYKLKKLPKFVCMKSLKYLNLFQCKSLKEFPEICGDMRCLSNLCVGSPRIRSLPPSLSGLTVLQLTDCEILESIPNTIRNLTLFRMSNCKKLATLPNSLFESQQLNYLNISGCSGLVELPISLGVQKKLRFLAIDRCENLMKLPSFNQMESLQYLEISNSPKLDTFPEINGDMHNFKKLTLNSTGIREVPSSIGNLSGLESLYLEGCEGLVSLPDSLCNLMNLQRLHLTGCKRLEKLPENIGDLQKLEILDARETAISQPPSSITKLVGKLRILSLGGLPEDLGSFCFLEQLNVSGSNISCLPKSINKLKNLQYLNVQFCPNLDKLPRRELLPPNLEELFADYQLALKSIKAFVFDYLPLCRLVISDCGTVSSEEVDLLLRDFLPACIQYDFIQRDYFVISFPGERIPEVFGYARFENQKEILIDLHPSWYNTDEFVGFWISCGPTTLSTTLEVSLVCKSDPQRNHSLTYNNITGYSTLDDSTSRYPLICCFYIPLETLWGDSDNKEGRNPNDYDMLEVSQVNFLNEELCWGFHLENGKEAMSDSGHQKKKKKEEAMIDAKVYL